jgi:VIT1/CCC1 family predicted Fe2+/Mn2+ transporter
MSDGLVSNLSLVAGIAGASIERAGVVAGGLAGLVAGASSMAIGEYVSVRANAELLDRELAVERREIENDPEGERRELAAIYVQRGLSSTDAELVARTLMADPDVALEAHARDELGIDPGELGSPWRAARASMLSFSVGAFIPLVPWLVTAGDSAVIASLVLGVITALLLGGGLARLSHRPVVGGAARQAGLLLLAFVATSLVGRLVGGVF